MLETAIKYHQNNELDKAVEYYLKALRSEANQVEIYNRLLQIYTHNNDVDKIIYCYLRLIELEPQNPYHYFNAGINYYKKGDGENTFKAYLNAVYLKPDFTEAHINLGGLYQRVYDFKKAEKHLLKGLELNDNFFELYLNLGNLYVDTAETSKVIEISQRGLKKFPNNQSLLFNIARAEFLEGKLDKAWDYFKLRRLINEKQGLKTYLLDYRGSLKDKKVLVYSDSGYGDSLQFMRYLHFLDQQGAKVLLKIQPPLVSLVRSSNFNVEIVPADQKHQQVGHDLQINLTSLAYPYKITDYSNKYITVNPKKAQEYKDKYFNNNDFKIGIVWYSHANLYKKNISDVRAFYDIAKMPGVKLYSLQQTKGTPMLDNLPEDFHLIHLGDEFKDFSDTAAAVENLDLVLAIDTAVVHLAGAMGKPVWCMLPDVPNWRWFMEGDTTPWYNTMRLFRQTRPDDWTEVLQRVKIELEKTILQHEKV
ncbi:MAG: hypothetical protein A2Y25_01280 [Candidatus Melainabacteria bacterium GWF2_37_15]|nr:MAG: hypothetical protein A2Y25_01280 [Candidatus Melainabacteria bacterium GWF2_37_15]